jgi:hypothetical protein
MANPFYVDPTAGVNLGQSLAGLGQSIGKARLMQEAREKEAAQAERKQLGQQAIASAYQSGDPDEVAKVMIEYPEMSQALSDAVGFRSDATRRNLIDSSREILTNPNRAEEILTRRIQAVTNEGGDPTESVMALKEYQENPEGFLQANKMLYAGLDQPGYQAWKDAQPKEEVMTPYQSSQVELKREDQRLRQLEADLAQETNELKRQKLEADVALQQSKVKDAELKQEAAQGKVDASKEMANEAISVAKDILGDSSFSDVVGTIDAMTPVVSGESQDLLNKFERLQSLLTVDNLKLMTGVLTDRDIRFLTNVASGLNITESGVKGSEAGVKKRLEDIVKRIEAGSNSKKETKQEATQTVNWDDL